MQKKYRKFQSKSFKKDGKTIILLKCATCDSKKSKFIKKQEASGILSNLGLKTLLNKILLLGDILI